MAERWSPQDICDLARKLGAQTKQKGRELVFTLCPYCQGGGPGGGHDKETFSVNLDTGFFKCFRASCGRQGHFVQMARDFHYPLTKEPPPRRYRALPQKPVETRNPAIRYLKSRGIGEEVARRYHITTRKDNDHILVFPFYDEKGVLQFIKYRKTDFDKSRDKNKEWCEKGTKPVLFGMDQCEGFDTLVITEGQLDSLSVAQAGVKNAVSVPTGAKGFTWLDPCWEWVTKFQEVTVFGDCENGQVTLVEELNRRLPGTVKVVQVEDYRGQKDANDLLRACGPEAVRHAVQNAKPVPMRHIKRLADVKSVDLRTLPHIVTGLPPLDRVIGGLYFGQVALLTGKRGEGKSTLMGQLVAEALNQRYRVLAYSGELPDYHFRRWLDLQLAGPQHVVTRQNRFSDPCYDLPPETVEKLGAWYYDRAFLYDNNALDEGNETDSLLHTLEKAVRRYGIELICIDNLMTAIDVESADSQYIQQSKFVRALKRLAVQYHLAVLLVAHPRKTQGDVCDNDMVSGSSDITNRVDVVLSYQKNPPDDPPGGKIWVLKNRMTGKLALREKAVAVRYDEGSKRLYPQSGSPFYRYAWEKEAGEDVTALDDLPF